jgi:hypothetical protein
LLKAAAAGLAGALCAGTLSGCAQLTRAYPQSVAPRGALTPVQSLHGARLMPRVGPGGTPVPHDGFGPLTFFVFPVAVAASPFATVIADAGAGRLYRYDPAVDAMAVVPGALVTPQTRLALGPDGSVYVANRGSAPVRRYDRDGRLLQEIVPYPGGAAYGDIAIDGVNGMVYALDQGLGRVEEVHPLGRSATLLAEELMYGPPTAIAWDDRRLYLAGVHCGCVVAVSPLERTRTLVAQGLRRPAALAAGDGWLAVLDTAARKLSLFRHGLPYADATTESLRLIDPQGIALSGGLLYVADAAGRRVAVFRIGK